MSGSPVCHSDLALPLLWEHGGLVFQVVQLCGGWLYRAVPLTGSLWIFTVSKTYIFVVSRHWLGAWYVALLSLS